MSGKGVRNYCFTVNNYSEEDESQCYAMAWEWNIKYIVVGREYGELGTPHLQGLVCFKDAKTLSAVKKLFPTAHFEEMRGTFEQASDYCKKEGDFFEWGILPMDQQRKGEKGREWYQEQLKAVSEQRYFDVDPAYLIANFNGLHKAASLLYPPKLLDTEQKMEWYYGASGTGKSRRAREENPGAYLKMCNKWWDGYTGQEVVIIEDFDVDHKVLCHHLKIWADRYPFPAEVKGGKIDIRPKKIIVTSNYHPGMIWEKETDLQPILRRFRVTYFDVNK